MNRRSILAAALLAALALLPALVARADLLEQGVYKLYQGDRPLGTETFEYVTTNDSLVVRARQNLTVPTSRGDEKFQKGADILINTEHMTMRGYQSTRVFRGTTVIRGLVFADTHYVAYREGEGEFATGDSYVLPPGHLYVMDSQIISLFDILCRNLSGTSLERRPIHLLALGPRDTMLDAVVVERGTETIRWGGKPVVAHKMDIVADSRTTFTAWTGTKGQLLRLTEPVSGLRVQREPPAVRRKTAPSPAPPPKPGG